VAWRGTFTISFSMIAIFLHAAIILVDLRVYQPFFLGSFSLSENMCLYLHVGSWTIKNIHGKHMLKSGGLVDQQAVNLHNYSGTFKSH
jgi:hypothetical protein